MLADDAAVLREGPARMLVTTGVEVAAQVSPAAELLAAVKDTRPNVAVVEIRPSPRPRSSERGRPAHLRPGQEGNAMSVGRAEPAPRRLSVGGAIYAAAKTFRPRVTSTRPLCLGCQTRESRPIRARL